MIKIKSGSEIEAMRRGGRILALILKKLAGAVKPGVSTRLLADMAAAELASHGAKAAFLNYQDFPSPLCVSLNQEVVHGIPSAQRLIKAGDIVSLDFGVKHQGLMTDSAVSVIAGPPTETTRHLVNTTRAAMNLGIKQAVAGKQVGDISHAIQRHLETNGLSVVRALVGHGVGRSLHEEPNVPNFGRPATGPTLQPGMTIAIEPMATLGDYPVHIAADGWTVITNDGSLAAHFEHTVLITKDQPEILTKI